MLHMPVLPREGPGRCNRIPEWCNRMPGVGRKCLVLTCRCGVSRSEATNRAMSIVYKHLFIEASRAWRTWHHRSVPGAREKKVSRANQREQTEQHTGFPCLNYNSDKKLNRFLSLENWRGLQPPGDPGLYGGGLFLGSGTNIESTWVQHRPEPHTRAWRSCGCFLKFLLSFSDGSIKVNLED